MVSGKVNLAEKLAQFDERWSPRIVAQLNDYKVQLVKVQGEFVWHHHAETDELFYVLKGTMAIQLPDRTVELREGELFVVPRGVEHCPVAQSEAHILLMEPMGTVNTGSAGGDRTAPEQRI